MSDDAFRLSYSIAFDCSIRPFFDLFHLDERDQARNAPQISVGTFELKKVL